MSLTPDQLASLDIKAGWPLPDVAQAVAVELSESGGNPNVVGWDYQGSTVKDTTGTTQPGVPFDSYDIGLFQYNSSHNTNTVNGQPATPGTFDPNFLSSLENPTTNTQKALSLFKSNGWQPWDSDSAIKSGANFAAGEQAVYDVTGSNAAENEQVPSSSYAGSGAGSGSVPNTTSTGTSTGTGTDSPSTTDNKETYKLTGLAGVLQDLDGLLNPTPGTFTILNGVPFLQTSITNPGSSIETTIEELLVRGLFTIMFMGLTYLGIKTITGTSRSSGIQTIIEQSATSARQQQRSATQLATEELRSQPKQSTVTYNYGPKQSTNTRISRRENESHIYYHKASEE